MRLVTLVKDTQFGSVASQGAYVVSIAAMNVIVVRQWGAAERGDLAVFIVVSTMAATLGGLGFSDVAIWAHGRAKGTGLAPVFRRSVPWVVASGVWGAAGTTLILPLPLAVTVVVGALLLHVFRSATALQLATGEIAKFNVHRTALPVAATVGTITAALLDVSSPVYGYLGGQVVATIMVGGVIFRHGLLRSGTEPAPGAREVGRQSVVGNLLGSSLSRIDVLAVGLLASPAATGIYSVALSVSEVSLTGAYALSFHALREGATTDQAAQRTMRRAVWSTAVLSLLGLGGLWLLAEPVLGPDFSALPLTFGLLAPGVVALSVVRVRFSADLTAERGKLATRALALATVSMLILDTLLVPHFEEHGAAVASTVAYLIALCAVLKTRGPAGTGPSA